MPATSPLKRPRLLVLTTTFPRWADDHEPGFVFELCRRLRDFEVHVIAPHAKGAADHEIMDGVHVHRFRYAPAALETLAYNGGIAANLKRSRWKYLLLQGFLLGMFFRAFQVARKADIHLIHAHWMIPTGLIGATLRELLPGDNRLLLTAHGGDVHSLRGKLFARLRRWVAGEADAVCVVGRNLLNSAREEAWQNPQVQVAAMGVDLRETFVPDAPRVAGKTLVFAGRLVSKKGVPHLLEAMRLLVDIEPEARLLIAGHGPLQEMLKARSDSLGLEDHVRFLGKYSLGQLPQILRQGSITVLPFDTAEDGDQEGLGLTTVEAMGCGIPVIAGDVPAVHDVIEHERTGLLINARDHQALCDAILRLWQQPDFAAELAAAAREQALEHFDWKVVADNHTKILQQL